MEIFVYNLNENIYVKKEKSLIDWILVIKFWTRFALSRKLELNGTSFHYIEYLNLYCLVILFII